MNKIDDWAHRFWTYDMYYAYSDDHREWKAGLKAEQKMKEDLDKDNLIMGEKMEIIRRVGELYDNKCNELKARGDTVSQPMWNEGDGPDLKYFMEAVLKVKNG